MKYLKHRKFTAYVTVANYKQFDNTEKSSRSSRVFLACAEKNINVAPERVKKYKKKSMGKMARQINLDSSTMKTNLLTGIWFSPLKLETLQQLKARQNLKQTS